MDLFFGKIIFHRQVNKGDFRETDQDVMLEELEAVLRKYGVELARYELAQLLGEYISTGKCDRCGYLTLDESNSSEKIEKGDVYDDLNEIIHLGHMKEGKLICAECEESKE